MPFDQVGYQPETVVRDEVLRCLIEARKMIEKPGVWVRNPGCGRTAMCAVVAVNEAHEDLGGYHPTKYAAWDLLRASLPDGWSMTGDFNDDPATELADVLALFDRAISARRAELVKP